MKFFCNLEYQLVNRRMSDKQCDKPSLKNLNWELCQSKQFYN